MFIADDDLVDEEGDPSIWSSACSDRMSSSISPFFRLISCKSVRSSVSPEVKEEAEAVIKEAFLFAWMEIGALNPREEELDDVEAANCDVILIFGFFSNILL